MFCKLDRLVKSNFFGVLFLFGIFPTEAVKRTKISKRIETAKATNSAKISRTS
jgi:hypothetical protein